MITVEQLESFYTYFYSKKYRDHQYRLKATKTVNSVCEVFLSLVDKEYSLHSVSETFLWDYFIFQFQYWEECLLENKFTDKIAIAWIVGKKAFERWKNRDREKDWLIDKAQILELYEVKKKDLFAIRKMQTKENTFDSSKIIRKQYLNTEGGFAKCIEFTTLFDPTDYSCIKCKSRTDCKELLRVNYPKLFKERIN